MTHVYREFADIWDAQKRERLQGGRDPLRFDQLITIDTSIKHRQVVNYLASTARPAIVIAGRGMCAGGRIVDYLKAMLGNPRHNVLFVGYRQRAHPAPPFKKTRT